MWLSAAPVDEVEIRPCLVVAALISGAQAWRFMRNGKSAVKTNFPVLVKFRRLHEPAHVGPASWNRTWSPQGCRARRRWQSAVRRGFYNGTDVVSTTAPPRCPIEITCNQVHVFAKHHGTNCEDELFRNTTFSLSSILLIWKDRTVNVFWLLRSGRRKEARDGTPWSPSINLSGQVSPGIVEVKCGGIVLGQGAKVLNGSTQGIYPRQ